MDSETRPTDEEALELFAAARRPWPTVQDLLSALTHPEEAAIPPGESPVTWLAAWYQGEDAESGIREALVGGVLGLLDSPDTDGGTLARAMAFVEAVKLEEACRPLRTLVASRTLTEPRDKFSDLHGRALRALFILNALNPMQCLEEELRYGQYAPLAFAFVREKAKEQIAGTLPKIAHLSFFPKALRTVLLTYPDKEGIDILGAAARYMRRDGPSATQAFLNAIPHLPLQWRDRDDLIAILKNKPVEAQPVPRPPAIQQPWGYVGEYRGLRARSPGIPKSLPALRAAAAGGR